MHLYNAVITLEDYIDETVKGRKFKSRFLAPGIAGYPEQFGNVLVRKESLDRFIGTMIGVPVIVNHKDLSKDNANDERVGVVCNVWFDEHDGWYWCDGVIWDETAQNLITDRGWSVSCSYDVKLADDTGGTENNIPYDIEFLDGVFTHLAIVDNPRYERANIVFNAKAARGVENQTFCTKSKFSAKAVAEGRRTHTAAVSRRGKSGDPFNADEQDARGVENQTFCTKSKFSAKAVAEGVGLTRRRRTGGASPETRPHPPLAGRVPTSEKSPYSSTGITNTIKGDNMDKKEKIMNILAGADLEEELLQEIENALDEETPEQEMNQKEPGSSEVKNSKETFFEKMLNVYNKSICPQDAYMYLSRTAKLDMANKYFGK